MNYSQTYMRYYVKALSTDFLSLFLDDKVILLTRTVLIYDIL